MSATHLDIQLRHALQTAAGPVSMEVAFRLEQGSIMALTGPSGAGKSTLLRLIAGLLKPESGRISWGDEVWLDTTHKVFCKPQERNIGLVFQDYALFPHLTVRQNVAFGLEKGEDPGHVEELLREVELTKLAEQKPHQLSGGQQQRVALARALVRQPSVLLLDEPLSALDRSMRQRLQDYLLAIHHSRKLTVLLVTHDLSEIFRLTDQVVELDNGSIVRRGTPEEVFAETHPMADSPALYGEVLSCRPEREHVVVQALIDRRIHKLRLPIDRASDLYPGCSFVLRYSMDAPVVEVIR